MVREYEVIRRVKNFLYNGNKLNDNDFKIIFKDLEKRELIEVIRILKKNNVEIIINSKKNTKPMSIKSKQNINIDYKVLKNLSNEQLCELYKNGNKKVLDVLIEKNEALIWSRVRKYSKVFKHKLEDDDLFQSGAMGLIKAVENYEKDKGTNLSTYSVWWIDQKIKRDIVDSGFTIRLPVHVADLVLKVSYIVAKNSGLSQEELCELGKKEGISKDKFNMALSLRKNILSITSMNTLVGEDNETELIDLIEDKNENVVEDEVMEDTLKETMESLLNTLKEREKNVIKLRFGLTDGRDMTLEEIGNIYGLTRERIRQIEEKAILKLRHPSRINKIKDYYIKE